MNFQRAGILALIALFGLALVLGLVEKLRGRPVSRGATYVSALALASLAVYLLKAG